MRPLFWEVATALRPVRTSSRDFCRWEQNATMMTEAHSDRELIIPAEQTARAIYARADELEHRWQSAGISPEFRDRMVDAVFRFLARQSSSKAKFGTGTSEAHARMLLDSFWRRNVARNSRRRSQTAIRLDPDFSDPEDQFLPCRRRLLIRAIHCWIVSRGYPKEIATAFLLTHMGLDSVSIASEVRGVHRSPCTAHQVRQWRRRKFGSILCDLRARFLHF